MKLPALYFSTGNFTELIGAHRSCYIYITMLHYKNAVTVIYILLQEYLMLISKNACNIVILCNIKNKDKKKYYRGNSIVKDTRLPQFCKEAQRIKPKSLVQLKDCAIIIIRCF